MSSRPARITQHEVCRMVKAVRECGLSIAKITFDGERLDIFPEKLNSGDNAPQPLENDPSKPRLLREPR